MLLHLPIFDNLGETIETFTCNMFVACNKGKHCNHDETNISDFNFKRLHNTRSW